MMKRIARRKRIRTILSLLLVLALTVQTVAAEGLTAEVKEAEVRSAATMGKQAEEPIEIIAEVEELRSEYSKSFLRSDGSYLQVTSFEPIHYKKGDGYGEVDNRLEVVTKEGQTAYQNKEGGYRVSFPEDLTDPVEIQKGRHTISIRMLEGESTPPPATVNQGGFNKPRINNQKNKTKAEKEQKRDASQKGTDYGEVLPEYSIGEITYKNETEDVTVSYQSLSGRVKESIVLENADAARDSYAYRIEAEGLKASKEKDGRVLFYKKDKKKPVYTLEAPFMFDAGGEEGRSSEIAVKLERDGAAYRVTYAPSKEWVHDPSRTFPVTIDPTVTVQSGQGYFEDAYVTAGNPAQNLKGAQQADLYANGASYYYFRCSQFPNGDAAVLSSKLVLSATATTTDSTLGVRRLASGWSPDTATYNGRPTAEAWTMDYATVQNGRTELDVTPYAQDFSRREGADDHGLQIELLGSAPCSLYTVYAGDAAPYVVTEYSALAGDYAGYSQHAASAGRAGTLTVNDFTGRTQFEAEDLAIPGNRMPASIKRVRTTEGATGSSGFGGYFLTNYHQKLQRDEALNRWKFRTE